MAAGPTRLEARGMGEFRCHAEYEIQSTCAHACARACVENTRARARTLKSIHACARKQVVALQDRYELLIRVGGWQR
jgi:hypothetical protein